MDEINNSKKKSNTSGVEFVFLRNRKKLKNTSQDKQNFILNKKNPFIKQNINNNNLLIDKTIYKEKIDLNNKTHEDNTNKIKELEKMLNKLEKTDKKLDIEINNLKKEEEQLINEEKDKENEEKELKEE